MFTSLTMLIMLIMLVVLIALSTTHANAQQLRTNERENPIYISDSPIARDALIRLPELIAQGNEIQAVRLINQTIIEHGDRLIQSHSPEIYIPVRERIHQFVLEHPKLLDLYRLEYTPIAQSRLDSDHWQMVADQAWLTEPGFIASLHASQVLIESGHFRSASRTLDRLMVHPDADLHAKPAARLISLAARYINADDVWQQADAWADRAHQPRPIHKGIQRPLRIRSAPIPISSLEWNAHVYDAKNRGSSLDGIVPGSLGQAVLTLEPQIDDTGVEPIARSSGARWISTPWTAPVILDDRVYTNDGITISCFDRFTLRSHWRYRTAPQGVDLPITPADRSRLSRSIEDQTTITIVDGSLYTPAGLARNGTRMGDDRLLKLDAQTGQVQWSIIINTLDDSLKDASIRGQVVVDGDTVIVGARTNNREQRLISFAVVGLDAATGKTKWIRQVGSAGSLPFQQIGQLAHSPTLSQGVVYWTDYIGLAFAIDSATGELLWARPLPSPDLYDRFTRPAFASSTPIITEQGMFTLTTDGAQLLLLDLDTGEIIASRPAQPVGESLYLLRLKDTIACISKSMISFYPINHFDTGTITHTPTIGDSNQIRGRVISNGNKLLVSTDHGVDIIDPQSPSIIEHINLDMHGNIVVTDGQILITNENTINSFLAWNIASKLLSDRIESDPSAAITLAELAHRADQAQSTLPYVLQAIKAIDHAPFQTQRSLRDQLFVVVLDMINPASTKKASSSKVSLIDQPKLFQQLASLAHNHEQVLAHRMAWGQWNELQGNPKKAIRAYQDILDQPALGASMWEGSSIAVRGELEASRRIGEILNTLGYTPYQSFDQLAQTERDFLGDTADPKALEELAQRYPWSKRTPGTWLDASTRWKAMNQAPSAISAARNGLDSAIALIPFGIKADQRLIDQLAQIAIGGMIETNHPQNAQALASTIIPFFPDLSLQINGQPFSQSEIALHMRQANQLPRLGDSFIRTPEPLLITGSPIKPARRTDQSGIVLYAPQFGRLDYIHAGPKGFETLWTRKSMTNEPPLILWQDQSRILIFWPEGTETNDTGTLEAVQTTTGQTIWSVKNIQTDLEQHSQRAPDEIARIDGQFSTPIHGPIRLNQLITITDGSTIIVTDRIGRAAGIDLLTGQRLWNADLPANRVHDIDLAGGVLGICGVLVVDVALKQQDGATHSIAASVDPRTGKPLQVLDRLGQPPRWIRVDSNGNLYVATALQILSINTKAGGIDWIINDEELIESAAGWIAHDQLLVLNDNTELWMISLRGGAHTPAPLDDRQRIEPQGWIDVQSEIGLGLKDESINTIMVTTSRGMIIFDTQQRLLAADPMRVHTNLIDIAWGEERAIFVQRPQTIDRSSVATLYLLDITDASILDVTSIAVPITTNRQPTSITAITGGVLIGYNEVSLFVRVSEPLQK